MVKYDKELAEILQGRELSDLSVDEVNAIQKAAGRNKNAKA